MDDVVRALGYLCLGSRLKRMGERLQADAQTVIDAAGVDIQVSQYPLLAALDRLGPMTVGALVAALGVSQPGVTRATVKLADAGLVTIAPDADDQRRKIVALSERGAALVARSKQEVWPKIEGAVADLCADRSGALLVLLDAIEDDLGETPLLVRAERLAAGG